MSSFFPKLPRVTGDTDDDVSIHLYNNVGPARPLPKRKSSIYDEEVLKILEEDEDEGEVEEFNKLFKIFKETGKSGLDREVDIGDSDILDYDDETEVEDEDDLAAFKEQINRTYKDREEKKKGSGSGAGTGSKDTPTKSKATTNTRGTTGAPSVAVIKYFLYVLLGIGVALLCAVYFGSEIAPTVPHTGEGGEIRSLSSKLTKLELQADIMSQKQSVLEINQNKLTTSSNEKFEEIVQRFQKIDKSLKNSDNFQRLQAEFLKLNTSVNSVLENSDPNQLETKLNQVTKRLNELSEIGGNVEQLKTDILRRLLDQLPERIPVYIKDKKLHFIPEFHRFLTSFIERYNEDNPIWEREEFKKVIDTGKGGDSSISKGELENYLHAKFASNNKFLWGKLTAFIDELTLNVNSTTPASGNHIFTNGANQILLDNLLTTFAKGSLKINYADYNLGARILGFLTKSSPDDSPSTSFARKIFLGWYDYLSSPKEWNFNANNILIDGGKSWECNSNECSVGIRLFNPIILSDIIVKGIPQELGFFSSPSSISLYIKPRSKSQAEIIKSLSAFTSTSDLVDSMSANNKFLTKFINVKNFKLEPSKAINILKLPINLINLKIPIRDIYLKLNCPSGTKCGLYNVKIYGINEYNSYKFTQELDLITARLQEEIQEEELNNDGNSYEETEFIENNGEILGDDELYW